MSPVLLTLLVAVLMWYGSDIAAGLPLAEGLRIALFAILATTGTVVGFAGVVSFRKARTTVNPFRPGSSSALVDYGVFKWTRNPMYLGLLLALLGWGLFLNSYFSLALTVPYVLYLNRFQIQPEEKALEMAFGEEFVAYKKRVRRWI